MMYVESLSDKLHTTRIQSDLDLLSIQLVAIMIILQPLPIKIFQNQFLFNFRISNYVLRSPTSSWGIFTPCQRITLGK
jgi:hypothetical protein